MVVELLITALVAAVGLLGQALPEWQPIDLSAYTNGLNPFSNYQLIRDWLAFLNHYLPVNHALVLLGLLLSWWVAKGLASVVMWILTKVHLLGGSSDW